MRARPAWAIARPPTKCLHRHPPREAGGPARRHAGCRNANPAPQMWPASTLWVRPCRWPDRWSPFRRRAAQRLLDRIAIGSGIDHEQPLRLRQRQRRIDINPHPALKPRPPLLLAELAGMPKTGQEDLLSAKSSMAGSDDREERQYQFAHLRMSSKSRRVTLGGRRRWIAWERLEPSTLPTAHICDHVRNGPIVFGRAPIEPFKKRRLNIAIGADAISQTSHDQLIAFFDDPGPDRNLVLHREVPHARRSEFRRRNEMVLHVRILPCGGAVDQGNISTVPFLNRPARPPVAAVVCRNICEYTWFGMTARRTAIQERGKSTNASTYSRGTPRRLSGARSSRTGLEGLAFRRLSTAARGGWLDLHGYDV